MRKRRANRNPDRALPHRPAPPQSRAARIADLEKPLPGPLKRAALATAWALAALAALAAISTVLAGAAGATTTELEADGYAYGFVSRVEGEALLLGVDVDDPIEAEINHPLLTGDQINTRSGRIELVLPDGTILRAAPGTVVVFDVLAGAPDSEVDEGTFVSLDQGELQIRTPETFFEGDDLAVQTANATVYLSASGSYRILTQGSSFTEVVVRSGFAEADTRSGSEIARDGEALEISGNERPFVNVVEAGPADSLELWAGDLDRLAESARQRDVDPRLAYAAAPLEGNGEWVESPVGRAWRPYVRSDWRPFRYGRWVYTPSGLTWVPSARWGWVTSHYGSWDYVPGYGWLWLPGNVYFPAGVYWYWGPTHVAWIPSGYYGRYSRPGFSYGIYGWAGGDWGYWADWTFCPTRYFGRRGYDNYWDSGRNLQRERRFAVPRGIVTTDTRGLGPESWGKPSEALDRLTRRVDARDQGRSLPDVTDFVARRKGAEAVRPASGSRLLDRPRSTRSRLAPLPEDATRRSFGGRTVTDATDSARDARVRSVAGIRRGAGEDRSPSGSRGRLEDRPGATESRDSGDRSRELSGSTRGITRRVEPGTRGGSEPPSSRVRSVGDRRVDPGSRSVRDRRAPERDRGSSLGSSSRDRSGAAASPPARRVLDRIRAHRESARGSSSDSGSRSRGVTKGSSSSSSKSPPSRSSGSSTRSSGSSRGSVDKASPPSRGSKGTSSRGSSSRSRSRDNN